MTTSLENQLWLWLEDCEARKPGQDGLLIPNVRDQVVRVLQEESVRGREAKEAEALRFGLFSKLQ